MGKENKEYEEFLKSKKRTVQPIGKIIQASEVNPILFEFQRDIVLWSVKMGRCAVFADTGLGKALSIDTKVFTPTGHKPIGTIKIGDMVIGSDGKSTKVLGIYPQGIRAAYRITFSDNSSVLCDINHLWSVRTKVQKYRKQDYKTMSTMDILKSGLISQEGWKWFIPMAKPIEWENRELPLHPYLLGALIGDGSLSGGTPCISSADEELLSRISKILPDGVKLKYRSQYDWALTTGRKGYSNPLTLKLRQLGLMGKKSETKFIPEIYKLSSIQDRIDMLNGLMDTDGYASKDNNVNYCTISKRLAEDMVFLVQSLGGKAVIRTKKTTGQLAYQMSIVLPNDILPFSLSRKRDIIKPRMKYLPTRAIVSIEECGQSEMVCISVEAKDQLYVIEHAIVTHNTFIQLEWARFIGETILIFAPLSVARQTIREGKKIHADVRYIREQKEIMPGINITNYENIDNFDECWQIVDGIVLDESSILKSLAGETRRKLIKFFVDVKYKLCCTATPAPNDYTELGNHAEFLGVCSTAEMLSTYFVNGNKTSETVTDSGIILRKKHSNKNGTQWRMRYHAQKDYFRWLSSWAMAIRKPSDLGYDDDGFKLPKLNIIPIITNAEYVPVDELFFSGLKGLKQRADVRNQTANKKLLEIQKLTTGKEQWLIWCGLDVESKFAKDGIEDSIEVKGSQDVEYKAKAFEDFQDKKIRILITKGKIGGLGMNFQVCHNVIFFGLNDSWEMFYQCIRRCYRFGQKKEVNVYIVVSDIELEIYENIKRKGEMSERMMNGLIEEVKNYEMEELGKGVEKIQAEYTEKTVKGEKFTAMLGDSCERLKEIADESIDLSVYSPPFADLFTYSATERDLGNCKDWDEFFIHYGFIIKELNRITKQGRISCVHTSDIPAMQMKDGYIGIRDFPGAVIKAHIDAGWIFHGRAIVTKNPQAQAIRTHSKALLFAQLRRDSSDSRPALLDHILIFKKKGKAEKSVNPVANGEIDNERWIDWAGGIWTGISESDTLQYTTARDKNDEKHICPLQLGTIERCIKLYSNPGETILTPFGGISSEAYQAIRFKRKAILIELKPSYFRIAIENLKKAEHDSMESDLFTENKNV
ncbi:MAG: hypothetical protein IMZ53_12755 [Thermoplasmata archaeon]|nr:hypothetical protein [Thermoplasmata archaeon]